jgi:hypothetical protein
MKIKKIDIFRFVGYAAMGVLTGIVGFTPLTWQFWCFMAVLLYMDIIMNVID